MLIARYNLRHSDVAKEAGLDRTVLSQWLNEKRVPPKGALEKIVNAARKLAGV